MTKIFDKLIIAHQSKYTMFKDKIILKIYASYIKIYNNFKFVYQEII